MRRLAVTSASETPSASAASKCSKSFRTSSRKILQPVSALPDSGWIIQSLLREGLDRRSTFSTGRRMADRDFVDLLDRLGPPPRVLWLTCGNTSNSRLCSVLQDAGPRAVALLGSGEPLVEVSHRPWRSTSSQGRRSTTAAVRAGLDRVCERPEQFPVVHRKTRRVPLQRFPYSLPYRFGAGAVLLVAVFHAKRDPRR
jgi:hypothetical protein